MKRKFPADFSLFILLLFLIIQCSCLTKLGRAAGEVIGGGIDSALPVSFSIAKKDRECRFTDSAVSLKPFEFRNFLADAGLIAGYIGDIWLAFVYPVQNPKAASLQAGYYYSLLVLLNWIDPKYRILLSPYRRATGWQENRNSPCTNLGDFYYQRYEKNPIRRNCEEDFADFPNDFYKSLTENVLSKSSPSGMEISLVRQTVGEPILLDKSEISFPTTLCSAEYYIEFKGGEEALKNAVLKLQKKK